jgi:hypothetical protein
MLTIVVGIKRVDHLGLHQGLADAGPVFRGLVPRLLLDDF